MFCPQCGKTIPEESRFCFKCGSSLEAAIKLSPESRSQSLSPAPDEVAQTPPTWYCGSCGSAAPLTAKFCNECGTQRVEAICVDEPRDPQSASRAGNSPPKVSSESPELPDANGEPLNKELHLRNERTNVESSETTPSAQEASVSKKSGCASLIGWGLIFIGVLGGMQQLSRGPMDTFSTIFTMILLIVAGISWIRRWSIKRTAITLACALGVPVMAFIALPKTPRARMFSQETIVIREIQTIHQAQAQYMSRFGQYSTTLAQLGPPASGGPGPQAADLIPTSLASGEKDGYLFVMAATPQGYTINANPKVYNSTGRRTFFSDQSMAIHYNWSQEPANATSPELK